MKNFLGSRDLLILKKNNMGTKMHEQFPSGQRVYSTKE